MGQADQASIFPENADSALAMTAEQSTRAMWQALEDRILRLSKIAEDMDAAAQAFQGASLGLDVRSPGGSPAEVFEELLRAAQLATCSEPDEVATMGRYWRARWVEAQAIPDGPALPEDPETWTKIRRALKLGRPLARLAREVAEGIGELRKAARQ